MAKVGVLFLPVSGIGHLISTVELAKLLLKDPDSRFSVTILTMKVLIPAWASAITAYIESVSSLGLDITFQELPHVDPPSDRSVESFAAHVDAHKPLVRDAISGYLAASTAAPLAAVVLDMFCTSMIDVANEFGIPSYIYFTSAAALLSLMLYLPHHYLRDHTEGYIDVPGLPSLPLLSVPSIIRDKNDVNCKLFLRHGERFREANGVVINTFSELEPESMKALVGGRCLPDHVTPPIFPVGPLLALKPREDGLERHECLKWLDGQPRLSVVFLCFGSAGCFGRPQVKEIAEGLERSGHRFLWSLRSPANDSLLLPTDSNLDEVLPEGYLERVEDRGMVWPSWAPQVEILAHPAVGAFVTHCGWNSILESLWFGVPMLAWPLYAEQCLNAFAMGRVLGVALELKLAGDDGGFVRSEELERGVGLLMGDGEEGMKVRRRAEEMKAASRKAVQAGGSSAAALKSFMQKLVTENA